MSAAGNTERRKAERPLTVRVHSHDQIIAHGPRLAQLVGVAVVHHVIAAKTKALSAGDAPSSGAAHGDLPPAALGGSESRCCPSRRRDSRHRRRLPGRRLAPTRPRGTHRRRGAPGRGCRGDGRQSARGPQRAAPPALPPPPTCNPGGGDRGAEAQRSRDALFPLALTSRRTRRARAAVPPRRPPPPRCAAWPRCHRRHRRRAGPPARPAPRPPPPPSWGASAPAVGASRRPALRFAPPRPRRQLLFLRRVPLAQPRPNQPPGRVGCSSRGAAAGSTPCGGATGFRECVPSSSGRSGSASAKMGSLALRRGGGEGGGLAVAVPSRPPRSPPAHRS